MDNPVLQGSVMDVTANEYPFPGNPHYFDTVFYGEPPADGWPLNFALITASCPRHNRHATDEQNARANAKLRAALHARGFRPFQVTGASPDFSHREEGWGFTGASLEIATKLCVEFDQDAYFWVEDGEIFLATDASGRGWRVGFWDERLSPALTPRPATDGTK
jgi:hypothetical protein